MNGTTNNRYTFIDQIIVGVAIVVIAGTLVWMGTTLNAINANVSALLWQAKAADVQRTDHENRIRHLEQHFDIQ